jgi:hypothetical protein
MCRYNRRINDESTRKRKRSCDDDDDDNDKDFLPEDNTDMVVSAMEESRRCCTQNANRHDHVHDDDDDHDDADS